VASARTVNRKRGSETELANTAVGKVPQPTYRDRRKGLDPAVKGLDLELRNSKESGPEIHTL
jgi:hypothetical protein